MVQRGVFRSPARPWNRGRIIGARPPFKSKPVWAIRQPLKTAGGVRDLALFDCGIDAKLRGCDLVKLRVSDVAPGGARAAGLVRRGRRDDDRLFPSRRRPGDHITQRQHAKLVDRWVAMIDLESRAYGAHGLRHTKVALGYKKTGSSRA